MNQVKREIVQFSGLLEELLAGLSRTVTSPGVTLMETESFNGKWAKKDMWVRGEKKEWMKEGNRQRETYRAD